MRKNLLALLVGGLMYCTCVAQNNVTLNHSSHVRNISGIIRDTISNRPLEYATVSLFHLSDTTFEKGSMTNPQGKFFIEKVPCGWYLYKVEFLGYKKYTGKAFCVDKKDAELVLDPIVMQRDPKRLDEVIVNGHQEFERLELDKTSYKVSKSPVSDGGSITEVLETIPKIGIDPQGKVSLRGSTNVTILVDGKVSAMLGASPSEVLAQLPARSVDRVEVITNPSAKYDASGTSGIINIVMKKDRVKGFSGTITMTGGTRDKYSGATYMNYRVGKINWYGSYDYQNQWFDKDQKVDRIQNTGSLRQSTDMKLNQGSNLGKIGMDFLPSAKTTLGISVQRRIIDHDRKFRTSYLMEDAQIGLRDSILRRGSIDGDLESWVYNVNYLQTFSKKGRELSADCSYSSSQTMYDGKYFHRHYYPVEGNELMSIDRQDINKWNGVWQVDYTEPLGTGSSLEMGYKGDRSITDFSDGDNYFGYEKSIHGGYMMASGKWKNISCQVGIRGEYTHIKTNQNYDPHYFDLFPSAHLSWGLPHKNQLQMSYSRRIFRPSTRMVNPNQNNKDPENQYLGNPFLRPEYSHDLEFTYNKKWSKMSITSNLYWIRTTDIIQQYRFLGDDGLGFVRYQNLNYKNYSGLDLNMTCRIASWCKINTYLSGVYTNYKGGTLINSQSNDDLFWFGKMTTLIRVSKKTYIHVSAVYEDENPILQGHWDNLFFMDFALSKRVMKNRGSISIRVKDLFNTKKNKSITGDGSFSQTNCFNYESRIAFLSFRYNFGKKYKINRSKKRHEEVEREGKDI